MQSEITPVKAINFGIKELWSSKELIYFFTWRDIRVKYKQTALGVIWIILQPVMLALIFTIFIGSRLKMPEQNIPYSVFTFSGLLIWTLFSSGLSNSANSMISNANIIKKIYFPRLIIPISSILVSIVDFLISTVIFIPLLIYYNISISWSFIFYIPASVILTLFTTMGLGCWLAALNIKYRDFRYILPFLIQFLLFVSPVIYPISFVENHFLQTLLSLNPLAGALELIRTPLTNKPLDSFMLISNCVVSSIILISGVFFFRKTEYYFADLV